MKKYLIFLLVAIFATTFNCFADNQCTIYNSGGAKAQVDRKGGQANSIGQLVVPISVSNYQNDSSKGKEVTVWVEVVDQNTRCVVARNSGTAWVKPHSNSGTGSVSFTGLKPGHDYLYQIDSAKLCE